MIKIDNPADCCGCTACASICPREAIAMRPDALGFLYPVVNMEECVNCGLCDRVCSFNNSYDKDGNFESPIAYGARHRDLNEVNNSRSGAVFVAISDYVLDQGGVVYGAGYVDHFKVVHKRAVSKVQRDEFRGSKYVQSDMTGVFRAVKDDLIHGETVLFSGTPCQTSSLRRFVGTKLQEKLFLVDLVCHGVPSPYIWRDYLTYLESQEKSEIIGVNFRDKNKYGWTSHRESFQYEKSNSHYIPTDTNWYTNHFYQHIMFRHSCGSCPYCNLQRPSDITIADFWGWEKQNSTVNSDDKGINLVLINSLKGKHLFEAIKQDLIHFSAELDAYLQPNLKHPSKIHKKRSKFEFDYQKHGFDYVYSKKYYEQSLLMRIKNKINRIIKK